MPSKWTIEKVTGLSGIIKMPQAFFHPDLQSIQFGSKKLPCHIIPTKEMEYQINDDLWVALGLPDQSLFSIESNETTIRLLPLIGLFTTPYVPGTQDPFGKETGFYKKWLQMTREKGGVAYFFSRDNINWEEGTIKGLICQNGYWQESDFPFPDVVYDRLPNRKAEQFNWVTPLKTSFENDYGIPWFNPCFFNKWNIYTLLNEIEDLKPFLPETRLYSEKNLKAFLNKYPAVYLKPKDKSLGVGIIRIQRLNEDGFRYQKSGESDSEERVSPDWGHLLQSLSSDLSLSERRHYLIQQGVALDQFKNRSFDFRVHTNKDKEGQWRLTAVAAKLAGLNQVTTHLAYGGDVRTLSELFDKQSALDTLRQLETISLSISCALAKKMPGMIGELGFDIGRDQDGRLFLFEVNSKPRHHIFLTPSVRNQLKLVHFHWFDFCTYLAQLSTDDPEHLFLEKATSLY
ncbi:MAG TPA: YheC/YheD family protein [Candidatus Angelobacter sp.]|nr:YheC/YheD family protein [Candidatus Angelobacter sp.]